MQTLSLLFFWFISLFCFRFLTTCKSEYFHPSLVEVLVSLVLHMFDKILSETCMQAYYAIFHWFYFFKVVPIFFLQFCTKSSYHFFLVSHLSHHPSFWFLLEVLHASMILIYTFFFIIFNKFLCYFYFCFFLCFLSKISI